MQQPSNKEIVLSFLGLVTSGAIDEAYERFIATDFIHHNPNFNGNAYALRNAMIENAMAYPTLQFHLQQIVAEADRVVVHARVVLEPGNPDLSVVHIFKIKDGFITELWDITMPAPSEMVNEKGLF